MANRKLFSFIFAISLVLMNMKSALSTPPARLVTASWYSVASLKKEGTWKTSKGVMANGKFFKDDGLTCATRLYPLGTFLVVYNLTTGSQVIVKVTDRIGKRFASTRIDLSKRAFSQIADLKQGLVSVKVEVVR